MMPIAPCGRRSLQERVGASYAFTPNLALDARIYNLFDRDYAFSTYGNEQWILGRPQSFDVSVRAKF